MNQIQPTYHNRVRYILRNITFGNKIISEPEGWNDDEKTFKRSLKVHGVFINLSNNLKFYRGDENRDGGFDYITGVYSQQGINADILLIKEERDPQTDKWVEAYRGFLDLSTLIVENNKASVKFNESGLYSALKARQSEKLDLGRTETMDGDSLDPIKTDTVALNGRNIFLVSTLGLNDNYKNFVVDDLFPFNPNEAVALPFSIVSLSDDSVQEIVDLDVTEVGSSYGDGSTGNMFYAISDKDRTFKSISIDVNIDFQAAIFKNFNIRLDLVTYENGLSYDFKSFQTLDQVNSVTGEGNITYKNTLTDYSLLKDESLCLALHVISQSDVNVVYNDINLNIEEDSFDDVSPKQSKILLPFEALERIINITTNEKDALKSKFLDRTDLGATEDGDGSLTAITNGFTIRNFEDKQIQTSFKDFDDSFSAVWNTGYGIERLGFKEFVRYEDLKYFYQKFVAVSLPNQVKKVKRTVAKDYFFSGVELGYKKPSGDNLYEEAMGVDEYNIKNTYTTIIKRVEKVFSKLSPYRADAYGIEFARRKSIKTNPTDDTRYDNDVFMLDLKRSETDIFEQRLWQDDFAKAPTGVFSPSTAQNLRFSPANIRTRFGWWISAGLDKYLSSFVRFSSSIGNSELSTQLLGENEIAENGNIQVKDLETSFFIPEIIEFEHEVTTEIIKKVQGKTLINGENVMNYYGQIEFTNENNDSETGYLLELQPNKEGRWKLIKANKPIGRAIDNVVINPITTAPNNLTASNITEISVDLNWGVSTSADGIAYYQVYQDGVLIANPISNTYQVEGLTVNNTYSFYVVGVSNNNVLSNPSNTIQVLTEAAPTIYDDASVVYSLRNVLNWDNNAVLKITRSSDSAMKYVFFDGQTITLNSKVGDSNTVKSAMSLGTWVGTDDALVEEWIGQINGGVIDNDKILIQSANLNPRLITNGIIDTKNGLPTLTFLPSTGRMFASVLPALDSGNTFTSLTVSHSDLSSSVNGIFVTGNISRGYRLFNDRTANRLGAFIVSTGGNFAVNLIAQQNNADQRLQTNVVTSSNDDFYFNNTLQESQAWSGSYDNTTFKIGSNVGNVTPLNGSIQEFIIFPSDKTADLSTLHSDINSYYSIY